MAKIGAGLDAQRIQSGEATPTPSDTLNDVLQKAVGSLSESMNTQGETDETTVSPVAPEVSGFTPEDELLPISQRWNPAKSGQLNPQFGDWEQTGTVVDDSFDQPARSSKPSVGGDPSTELLNRAKRTASMMNPMDRSTPNISFNTHLDADSRDKYVELNKRKAMALDDNERAGLDKQIRDVVSKRSNKDNTILDTMTSKLNALRADPVTGYASPDPRFLITAQLATEHELDMMFLGNSGETEFVEPDVDGDDKPKMSKELINPADGAERVGRQIGTWWNAENNGQTKAETMTPQENKDLGAQHLLAYSEANPNMVTATRVRTNEAGEADPNGTKNPWRFQLTPEGADILEQNREFRQRALGINIGPESSPKPAGLAGAKAELKPAYRKKNKIGGKDDPAYATLSQFEEAIANQNGVAHMVDDRRMRIATAMMFPSLFGKIGNPNDAFGDVFGLGRKAFETVRKEKMDLDGMEESQALDEAIKITRSKKADAARDIKTLAMYRKSPNYLTYAMQPLQGRMMAQQSEFNPTRKKVVRFATRSKHPARISGRSGRAYNNYMNIMALSFGSDAALEKGRMADLQENKAKYYKWGEILESALDEVFPQSEFEQLADAVAQGATVPNMEQKFLQFQNKVKVDPTLLDFLLDKGEDSMMAVDALIDFKNFNDNMDAGRTHNTFVNAYVDGKTNGIANQGMMLGNREIAARVGALRSDDAQTAVGEGDIRDAMSTLISDRLTQGIPFLTQQQTTGKEELIRSVLRDIGTYKAINKTISMVFPYGKEIAGLKREMEKHIPELMVANQDFANRMNQLEASGLGRDEILNAAHDNVVYALFELFGADTFNTRGLMRSVGFMHALGNKLFSLRGPSGHRILLGDNRNDTESITQSKVSMRANDNRTSLTLQNSETYMSSAANKDGESAGYVRGRASVIPTQSIDAATVVRTATGSSWNKLKQNHPAQDPYFLQIYDAFKVDVHSYDGLVEEVNKNFLDITTRDWNFVSEALKEYRTMIRDLRKTLQSAPDKEWTMKGGEFDYLYDLMDPQYEQSEFGVKPTRQAAKSFIKAADPIDPDTDVVYSDKAKRPRRKGEAVQTPALRIKGYDEYLGERTMRFQNALIAAFNSEASNGKSIGANSFLKPDEAPKLINSRQVLNILDKIEAGVKLDDRLSALSQKSNYNREKLRKEILDQEKRTGVGVLQFWAH